MIKPYGLAGRPRGQIGYLPSVCKEQYLCNEVLNFKYITNSGTGLPCTRLNPTANHAQPVTRLTSDYGLYYLEEESNVGTWSTQSQKRPTANDTNGRLWL